MEKELCSNFHLSLLVVKLIFNALTEKRDRSRQIWSNTKCHLTRLYSFLAKYQQHMYIKFTYTSQLFQHQMLKKHKESYLNYEKHYHSSYKNSISETKLKLEFIILFKQLK